MNIPVRASKSAISGTNKLAVALIKFSLCILRAGRFIIGPPEEGASGPVLWTDEIR